MVEKLDNNEKLSENITNENCVHAERHAGVLEEWKR